MLLTFNILPPLLINQGYLHVDFIASIMTIYRQMVKQIEFLAQNLIKLRKTRNLSQMKLAKLASLPRTTLSSFESGSGNPTLINLLRLSEALQVKIEELLSAPRDPVELIKKNDIKVKKKIKNSYIFDLLPDPVINLDLEKLEIAPNEYLGGNPHTPHSKEYFICLKGKAELNVSGEKYIVDEGDIFIFPGDSKHSYRNLNNTSLLALSIIHRP